MSTSGAIGLAMGGIRDVQTSEYLVSDGSMWPQVVAVLVPRFGLGSGILEVEELVLVQTSQTEPAVEGLAVGIVRWFSRSREVEDDAVGEGLEIHLFRCELAAIVQSDAPRTAELGNCGCESIDGVGSLGLTSGPDTRAHAARVIDQRQDLDSAAIEQFGVHPIHRLAVVRGCGWSAILVQLGADPATCASSAVSPVCTTGSPALR